MKDNYGLFPKKHILPYDGMSINANVWDEAHNYHSQVQNAHQYFLHGMGIVVGLDVVASDPPDNIVFVLPGVAIDTSGKMIILSEPVAYDLGEKINGKLHLFLLHREVKIQAAKTEENNVPAYMQDEYVIVARTDELDTPHVEIARIHRETVKSAIHDAAQANAPRANEIDLRFRKFVCPPPSEQVLAGVSYLGKATEKNYDQALIHLIKPLANESPYHLIVENDVPLDESLFNYQLIYLLATNTARLDKKQAETLQNFIQNDGKILVEFSEQVSEEHAVELLKPLGVALTKLTPAHPVFQAPYLFSQSPQGSLSQDGVVLWQAEPGILCTNGSYGAAWRGQAQQPALNRELIRSAIEWGVNLLVYLLAS
jgi:hypothetical protein